MEQVVDSLRRIIGRWVNTVTPLTADANIGDSILTVRNTARFRKDDEILVRGAKKFEKKPNFRVEEIIDDTHMRVSPPIALHNWKANEGSVVQKLIHGNAVKKIHIGDPENITELPAIIINGISEETPEWLTLDSVKDVFNVEIVILVEDSTQEEGYRFLMRLAKHVKFGLMNNLFPLVNDYETTALTADANAGDLYVKVADSSIFTCGSAILFENPYRSMEHRVSEIIDANTIKVYGGMPGTFTVEEGTSVILVKRFIFNSYPKSINYGKLSKGSLMKAAVIEWFGWECVVPPEGGDGWIDPQIH